MSNSDCKSPPEGAERLIDIGSGAGFPALPLAIVLPTLRVTALDATRKKVAFTETATKELGLDNLEAHWGRAEEVAHQTDRRGAYDRATVRAVGDLRTVAELALPFLGQGGRLIAFRGEKAAEETGVAGEAFRLLGGKLEQIERIELAALSLRYLVVIRKVGETPEKYPRRAGMPKKRPLG